MTDATLTLPDYAPALTLQERIDFWAQRKPDVGMPVDFEKGEKRIAQFKAMPPFNDRLDLWEAFLEASRLTEAGLAEILGAPEAAFADHPLARGRWMQEVAEVFQSQSEGGQEMAWPEAFGPQGRLLTFSRPFLLRALQRLYTEAAAYGHAPEDLEALFAVPMMGKAFVLTHRTLVLELNVARLEDRLQGETPEARFDSYIALLEDPEYTLALHREYPVMSRLLVEELDQLVDVFLDFLGHLDQDRARLQATFFGGEDPGRLIKVSMSGDGHRGGHRVLSLAFEQGRLIYKPHSLSVDGHFQNLLSWFNAQGHEPAFRTLACLDFGDHGWAEFIAEADCEDPDQIDRFYLRQGGLLALLYALLATDFHHENLIASGEHPVLVDLESLFHPHIKPQDADALALVAQERLNYSVLRTAMLPTPEFRGDSESPMDVAGLSDVEGQEGGKTLPYIHMEVPDEARIERMRGTMGKSQNLPTLRGEKPCPAEHVDQLIQGFTSTYQFILAHRKDLLAPEGPLQAFAEDPVRYIFRNTHTYALLLRETHHPDLQRDALDREAHFLRLWAILDSRRDYDRMIHSELHALWKGDVPFFYTRFGSLDLYDHRDQAVTDLLDETCMSMVHRHIESLGESDLKRQIWFITGAMACHDIDMEQRLSWSRASSTESVADPEASFPAPSREDYLQEARRIGDRLCELALVNAHGDHATWLGLVFLREKVWRFMPLGMDLYNGLGGISLFLAYLGDMTGEGRYTELARGAVEHLLSQKKQMESAITINGGFAGWGGVTYLMAHLAQLWKDDALLEQGRSCARHMLLKASEDEEFEVVYGNAGGILSLEALLRVAGSPDAQQAMEACAARLEHQAQARGDGLVWFSKSMGSAPLAGFSHGASGIAAALEAAARLTGHESFLRQAEQALIYERSLFAPERDNWRDLRTVPPSADSEAPLPDKFPVAWCNGSPGIGLARLRMKALDAEASRRDVASALRSTLQEGFGYNHSLCHGDMGNLDFLLEAQRQGHPGIGAAEVQRRGAAVLDSIQRQGWVGGTPKGLESPGLMTGLAGIGYQCLRLADPDRIPSVLMMEAPRA